MVRNAKAKVKRIKEIHGRDVSGDLQLPKVDAIQTRKDFNKIKEQLKDFTKRSNQKYTYIKNEQGVSASKSEINELKRNTKKAQKIADKIIAEISPMPYYTAFSDKPSGTVGEQMLKLMRPEIGIIRPKDFDFNAIRTESYFREKIESMRERSEPDYFDKRKVSLKQNIILKIQRSFNSDGDDLVDRIIDIDPDTLYELYLQHEEFQFGYRYEQQYLYANSKQADADEDIERLNHVLDRYYGGELNMDLKGFD